MDNAVRPPQWVTSSFSNGSGMCVEVRIDEPDVSIRDTKYRLKPEADPRLQPTITVPVDTWRRFTAAIRNGSTPDVGGALVALPVSDGTLLRSADGVTLDFTVAEWTAFTDGLHAGELQPEPATP